MKSKCIAGMLLVLVALARAEGARQWTVTLNIVDEAGLPVANAAVRVSYLLPTPIGEELRSGAVSGLTDTNGGFVASHSDNASSLGFHIEKNGYYPTFVRYSFGHGPGTESTNIPPQTLVLKTVRNPIAMYAKWLNERPPAMREPVGYDLKVGDWIAPHGNGTSSDILFTGEYDAGPPGGYESRISVGFPKPGDGIQEFQVAHPIGEGSGLRSPHEAPDNGYTSTVVRETSTGRGKPARFEFDENKVYFFRVRTVLDERGNVKSALYGKIYGDFMRFRYYLNTTPNDRNVEFDPKRNLMPNLKSAESVDAP